MPNIRWLEDVGLEDIAEVGGKAASLGELIRAGFAVPPGLCVTTQCFSRARRGGLPADVQEEILTAVDELRKRVSGDGLDDMRVAVRSSATREDLADASFAGIYQTFLGVEGGEEVIEAIRRCWDSTASPEAARYLTDTASGDSDVSMGVIVQAMVAADAAGVLFTVHPVTGKIDQAVVNASWGLGDAVVDGRGEPDTWLIGKDPFDVLEEKLGSKATQSEFGSSGAEPIRVVPSDPSAPSLDRAQLAELARVATRVERLYGFPQDVEFAFADGKLYLLQSRRVSTAQEAYYTWELHRWAREMGLSHDDDAMWARGTPLSALPLSPLYFSEMSRFFTRMFQELSSLRASKPSTRQNFRYYKGWSYTNVAIEQDLAPHPSTRIFDRGWFANKRPQLRHPRKLGIWSAHHYYYQQRDQVWLPDVARRRPDFETASVSELMEFIEFIEKQRLVRSAVAAIAVEHAGTLLDTLGSVLKRWAGEADAESLSILTSGLENSETHEENAAVWRLAEEARATPEVAAAVADEDLAALASNAEGRAYLEKVEAFARDHAHRGTSDRDLLQPRWGDSPAMLIRQLKVFVRSGGIESPEVSLERAAGRRADATRAVEARVRSGLLGPARLVAFRRLLRLTQEYWVYRDNQRHSFDHYFYNLRCAYRALGARLVDSEVLEDRDEVFFLSKEELWDAFSGVLAAGETRYRAQWRRNWWESCVADEPPSLLRGDEAFDADAAPVRADGVLEGVGGSAGRMTAPARVVPSIDRLTDVVEGEILVTQAIDPAWTPVFSLVAGVVSEEGGMLSHATVLAREYGIPAVIGLAGATKRIQSGQTITIDGAKGTVLIEE